MLWGWGGGLLGFTLAESGIRTLSIRCITPLVAITSLTSSLAPSTVTSPASDLASSSREESWLLVLTLPSTMPEQMTLGRMWFLGMK